jgi:hypothetical protein
MVPWSLSDRVSQQGLIADFHIQMEISVALSPPVGMAPREQP